MSWFDIFRIGKFKREIETQKVEYEKLLSTSKRLQAKCRGYKKKFSTLQAMEALGLDQAIKDLSLQKQQLEIHLSKLTEQIRSKEDQVIQLDETILLQSFALYEVRYDFEDSAMFKARLDKIRDEQKTMAKEGTATVSGTSWTVGGSEAEGKRMIKDYVKLILRSFNNECDATIVKAKYNNVESLEKKITKAAETLNKLGSRMGISIASKYVNLKIQELYLAYEYELKKQAEKEEQRRIKEQMREEAKALKEIENAKKKLEKEATHFNQALASLEEQIKSVQSPEELQKIEDEKLRIRTELEKVTEDIASNELREKNTRAGYVYVISNIGSFGENVYKIGMTKRLDPQDRIDELGDASVPYRFDVHAMIFSEDAPALETALHNTFAHRKLNLVNQRREFFNVSLAEIQRVVKDNFSNPVEFTLAAQAMEYRQSEKMREQMKKSGSVSYSESAERSFAFAAT